MKFEPGFIPIILIVIAVIGAVAYSATNPQVTTKDNFCTCKGMGNKVCPKTKTLKDLYNSGALTEFTDFAKLQGTPQWSK